MKALRTAKHITRVDHIQTFSFMVHNLLYHIWKFPSILKEMRKPDKATWRIGGSYLQLSLQYIKVKLVTLFAIFKVNLFRSSTNLFVNVLLPFCRMASYDYFTRKYFGMQLMHELFHEIQLIIIMMFSTQKDQGQWLLISMSNHPPDMDKTRTNNPPGRANTLLLDYTNFSHHPSVLNSYSPKNINIVLNKSCLHC